MLLEERGEGFNIINCGKHRSILIPFIIFKTTPEHLLRTLVILLHFSPGFTEVTFLQ